MSTITLSPVSTHHTGDATGSVIRQAMHAVARAIEIRRSLAQVREMDDHMLRDIGLTRAQAENAVRFGRAS